MAKPERPRGTARTRGGGVGQPPNHNKDIGKGAPQDPKSLGDLGGPGSREAECHRTAMNPGNNSKVILTTAFYFIK